MLWVRGVQGNITDLSQMFVGLQGRSPRTASALQTGQSPYSVMSVAMARKRFMTFFLGNTRAFQQVQVSTSDTRYSMLGPIVSV